MAYVMSLKGDLGRDLKRLENQDSKTDYCIYWVEVGEDGSYSNPKMLAYAIEKKEDFADWLALHDRPGKNGRFILVPTIPAKDVLNPTYYG